MLISSPTNVKEKDASRRYSFRSFIFNGLKVYLQCAKNVDEPACPRIGKQIAMYT
jgi:hypothetical protein